MKKEHIIDAFSLFLALTFSGFIDLLPLIKYSTEWFVLKFFQTLIASWFIRGVSRILFIPPRTFPEVPQRLSAFDDGIIGARYNLCSTSTKEIALWESPTFLYYLHLNTKKVISEKSIKTLRIDFSNDLRDKQMFYEEGRRLLADYGNEQKEKILREFNAIRFLIYPENVFREKEKEIRALISMQAIGGVYCIPVVREEILSRLTDLEKQVFENLSRRLSQKIDDEYTLVSRWDKFWLKKKKENNPYSVSIPDFQIIDAFVRSPNSLVQWYIGNTPRYSSNENDIRLAEESFKIIAKVVSDSWKDVVWNQYHPEMLTRVPIFVKLPEIPSMVTFFSQDYYRKWLEEIVPKSQKYEKLNEWIKKEQEILKEIVRDNKITRALDIGCGWGRLIDMLLREGAQFCAGVDIVPSVLQSDKVKELYKKYGKDRVNLRYEDATELISFGNEEFDLVICTTNTFGNMRPDEREKVIKQVYRVLKRNGIFILSVYANTTNAKNLREESYKEVGLRPYPSSDPTVIETQEGLYSKQFNWEEIETYLKKFKKIEKIEVDDIAFIAIAHK